MAFWIAVGSVVVMAGWSIATATYFAFRDDVLKGLIARQAEQQFAYEDRLAELRAQIDRTTSRQLLDQEQFEQKLEEFARREADARVAARRHLAALPIPSRPARSAAGRAALTVRRKAFAGRRRARAPRRSDHDRSLEPFRAPRAASATHMSPSTPGSTASRLRSIASRSGRPLGLRETGGALPRQGARAARRARRSWPQARGPRRRRAAAPSFR